jgi:hypothetical protein
LSMRSSGIKHDASKVDKTVADTVHEFYFFLPPLSFK